jgi:hypothetical protein
MAWNDLTFVECSVLTAAKMTELQGNFAALAAGETGAPPLAMDAVSSLAWLHASSGVLAPQVSSFGTVHAGSGLLAPQVSSFGTLHAGSGMLAPQVSSFGTLHAGSGVLAPQVSSFGTLHAGSGVLAPQVSSLGSVHVASAIVSPNGLALAGVSSFGALDVASNANFFGGLHFPHFALRYNGGNPPTIIRQTNVSCLERITVGRYVAHLSVPFTNSAYYVMLANGDLNSGSRNLNCNADSCTLALVSVIHHNTGTPVEGGTGNTILGFGD